MLEAGFSKVKIWWKNQRRSRRYTHPKMERLKIDDELIIEEDEGEAEKEEDGSEEEGDQLSGDEMDEYVEVEVIRQTKWWNVYLIGFL